MADSLEGSKAKARRGQVALRGQLALRGQVVALRKGSKGQVALRLWVAISSVVFRLVPVEKESVS